LSHEFRLGEGLVGQCALAKQPILLSNAPDDYVKISSGLGEAKPLTIIAQPIVYDDEVLGVLELAAFTALTDIQREILSRLADNLGVIIQKIWNQERTDRLLKRSQQLATEAQLRAEELRAANEELEEQSEELQALNEEIKEKSEEIQTANQELEEKSNLLETQIQEVARKSADIETISQYKSEFLANMSHELRTPLNSLLILSKSLEENREGNLTEQQVEAALVIHSGGQELLALINDILDLSKIEAGRLLPQWEPVVIANVLDYLRKQFEPVAQNKALTFEVLIEDEIPTTIITDEQRLVQILRNLLSNAFKFTSAGRVELRVGGDRDSSKDHTRMAFTVSDTGIGIAEDQLTSVFDAFQQGDGSTSRRYGGTGLGLTISKELAELLGGQLSVQSRVGEGSRFTLHLLVSKSATATAIADAQTQRERHSGDEVPAGRSTYELLVIGEGALPPVPPPSLHHLNETDRPLQGIKVLIVDDDMRNTYALAHALDERGIDSLMADNGQLALDKLEQEDDVALIVMDIMMPVMNGYEAMRRIREMPLYQNVPIIALTAQAMPEDHSKCLAAGASDYLTKPVDIEELLSMVRIWLDSRR
jgi:two-component system chemotaxis sensor kinase CheA